MKIELLMNDTNLTPEQQEFLNLHKKALTAGTFSSMYAYEFYKILKNIHDEKLYLSCGYEKFEEYTEECFSMKKSQIYKYLKIGDNFSEEFFHSSGKLGVSKMNLLLTLGSEEEVQDFVSNNDVDTMTVKELEIEIKKLKSELIDKNDTIAKLDSEIEELNTKDPIIKEVVKEVKVCDTEELEKLKKKISTLEKEKESLLSKETSTNDQEIKGLKKELKSLTAEKNQLSSTLEETMKKLSLADNKDYNRFKVQFIFVEQAINDIYKIVYAFEDIDFKNKCYLALNKLFERALKKND